MNENSSGNTKGRFESRVVFVTGAASGIGLATAASFVYEGAVVVGIDRNPDRIEKAQSEHPGIEFEACDVTDHTALERIVKQTIERHGRVDVLINNAGIEYLGSHARTTLEQWRHTQAVNVESMVVLSKLVVPQMIRQKHGRIINVASIKAFGAVAFDASYTASKAAICGLTRALAVELAPKHILVNAVAPGDIKTGMHLENQRNSGLSDEEMKDAEPAGVIPLGRQGRAEEVAAVILFLAGDQCSYITGQTIVVDGGMTIRL